MTAFMALFRNLPTSQKLMFPAALIAVVALWPSDQGLWSEPKGTQNRSLSSASPVVIDGDTLEINGQWVRIFGIDAPDEPFVARELASAQLIGLIEREGGVTCGAPSPAPGSCNRAVASYGRANLECAFPSGAEIGATMVAHGFAVDYREFSGGRFASLTRDAANEGKGLWARFPDQMVRLANDRGASCSSAPGA
ncbi:MAG: thermonuclease family protein [Pseudomonadota bacterium]